jgi:hypothetical protein
VSIESLVRDAMSHFPGQCAVANSQLVGETEVPVQMNNGGSARAQHVRDGLIRLEGPLAVAIPWNQLRMSHHDLNMLSLCDCIRKCYDDHLRYRRHLYLDRKQGYGEIELNTTSRFVAKLDYMMKQRAKQYKADTSIYHLMMSKGCSVHVFCFKGRIDDERLGEMRSNDAFTSMVQVGDYVLIWIDTFGTDTTQGGYETLCVEDSCLRKLKEICPWVEDEIDFMSDAGSGYKSSQTLLGLRNIKEVTGIRVRYVLFNASGKGER